MDGVEGAQLKTDKDLANLKTSIIIILYYFISVVVFSQEITGKVINANNSKPLEFVSIGVISKPIGTITNENGHFEINTKNISIESRVRFSMIGYKSQVFKIKELKNSNNIIVLEEEPFQLSEVIVKPSGRLREVGAPNSPLMKEVCGWEGIEFGKGYEIGSEMDLGVSPVKLINLQLDLKKQSFDSTLFRVHIRNIVGNLPEKELLSENIIFSVSQESGWIDVDLSKYNIVLKNKIAISIEWLKIYGVNEDRFVIHNKNKHATAVVVFRVKREKGSMFSRWGSEAIWKRIENKSPAFYLTVQE